MNEERKKQIRRALWVVLSIAIGLVFGTAFAFATSWHPGRSEDSDRGARERKAEMCMFNKGGLYEWQGYRYVEPERAHCQRCDKIDLQWPGGDSDSALRVCGFERVKIGGE